MNIKPNGSINNPNTPCNPADDCLDDRSLAMVYSVNQAFDRIYGTDADALEHGTLFIELYKPILAAGGGVEE